MPFFSKKENQQTSAMSSFGIPVSPRRIAPKVLLPGELAEKGAVARKVAVTMGGMNLTMSMTTKKEVMEKLRRRYQSRCALVI
jgi:hypothetical protein